MNTLKSSSSVVLFAIFTAIFPSVFVPVLAQDRSKKDLKPLSLDVGTLIQGEQGLQFEYSIEGGNVLKVGSQTLDKSSFSINFGTLGGVAKKWIKNASKSEFSKYYLLMKWPQILNPQKLEIITEKGTPLLTIDLEEKMFESWLDQLKNWSQSQNSPLKNIQLGLSENQFNADKLIKSKEGFRFCLIQKVDKNQSQICSGYYGISNVKSKVLMKPLNKGEQSVRVLLNGEEGKLKDLVPVEKGMVFRFFAELSNGVSFEVASKSPSVEIRNIQLNKSIYELYLQDVIPISPATQIEKEQYSKLTSLIGFESTIKDERKLWKFNLEAAQPTIYIMGNAGGV
ncbi:MAG TPA: hypothetical protein PLJ21_11880, partial [Pseudobdellovibrionaceae bacterium]|nr:hypothetical protein [Pseudobdellovibrionaceae bacterium]